MQMHHQGGHRGHPPADLSSHSNRMSSASDAWAPKVQRRYHSRFSRGSAGKTGGAIRYGTRNVSSRNRPLTLRGAPAVRRGAHFLYTLVMKEIINPLKQELSTPPTTDVCPICHAPLIQKRLKYFCTQCGQLCETCCDGGTSGK